MKSIVGGMMKRIAIGLGIAFGLLLLCLLTIERVFGDTPMMRRALRDLGPPSLPGLGLFASHSIDTCQRLIACAEAVFITCAHSSLDGTFLTVSIVGIAPEICVY